MRLPLLLPAAVLLLSTSAFADPVTYYVTETYSNFSLSGTITTDGTIGELKSKNITGYDLTLSDSDTSTALQGDSSFAHISGADAVTTTSGGGLFFNYDDNPGQSLLLAAQFGGSYVCFEGANAPCNGAVAPASEELAYFGTSGTAVDDTFSGNVEIGSTTPPVITPPVVPPPVVPPPVAATPEPSSLILLGTGILGVAGAARRRLFKG